MWWWCHVRQWLLQEEPLSKWRNMHRNMFGTTVLTQEDFLANTVSLKEKAARPIRLQEKGVLDCTLNHWWQQSILPSVLWLCLWTRVCMELDSVVQIVPNTGKHSLVWLQTELDSTQSYYHYYINLMLFWRSRCRCRRRILRSLQN